MIKKQTNKQTKKISLVSSFNSHKRPRQNFSLKYQYNIKKTSDEDKERYKLGDC